MVNPINRPDLIEQLSKITPTEGEWYNDKLNDRISCNNSVLYNSIYGMPDDDTLVQLAPTMRLEILAMAKEIKELKSQNEILLYSARKNNPF